MSLLSTIGSKDLEGWLATPLMWLCVWANQLWSGEVRNGFAAHIMAGWALTLTLGIIVRHSATWSVLEAFLMTLPALYGIFREVQDCQYWLSAWNRKNTVDLGTWIIGCLIGWSLCSLL